MCFEVLVVGITIFEIKASSSGAAFDIGKRVVRAYCNEAYLHFISGVRLKAGETAPGSAGILAGDFPLRAPFRTRCARRQGCRRSQVGPGSSLTHF